MKTKIGFIGFGNMAQAIAKGFLYVNAIKAEQIYAFDINQIVLDEAVKNGMNATSTVEAMIEQVDIVVLAVKPHLIEIVLAPIKEKLLNKIVISIAAGYPFEKYEAIMSENTHHISLIPNTPVAVGEGVLITEQRHSLTDVEFNLFSDIFSTIGLIEIVPTSLLDIGGTISGCGPAFVSMFIESLGDAAVKHGMPRSQAYKLAGQMVAGTGKLQVEKGEHPGVMKDAVCSPGGTTIIGVTTLERKGFRSAIIDAVDAIENK